MRQFRPFLVLGMFCAVASLGPIAAAVSDGLSADFNQDHVVDDGDLLQWKAEFGDGPAADANGDLISNGHDFMSWQRDLGGTSSPNLEVSHNPEPAAIVVWCLLAAISGLVIAARRRRDARTASAV